MLTQSQKELMKSILSGALPSPSPDLMAVAKEIEKIRLTAIFREYGLLPASGQVYEDFIPRTLTEKEWFEVISLINS